MTTTPAKRTHSTRLPFRARQSDATSAPSPSTISIPIWCVRILCAVGLLTAMLFAHGCHPDEDTELFGAVIELVK